MPLRNAAILIFLILLVFQIPAQKSLRVSYSRFGRPVTRDIFINDRFDYKLKGSHKFRSSTVANLNDTVIVMANDSLIPLSRLKAIRIHKNKYHLKLFQNIFLFGAVGYPALVGVNYLIVPDSEGWTEKTAIVSGSFLLAAAIMHELNITRLRINKRKHLVVLDRNYENLGNQ
ncbi:MAG: hypothetical protein JNL60_15900 [Bacteroidia bacterium]|nr:hypothetical protein [Bacteroidia bacterium]